MVNQTKILNFIIVIYFFLKLELINNLIPSLWFGFLLLITFSAISIFIKTPAVKNIYLLKKNIWVFISLITLFFYELFDFGNFRLDFMIQYLLSSIPFLIIGFNYSQNQKKIHHIIFSILTLYFLSYIYPIITYFFSSNFSREYLEYIVFNSQENAGLIHLWPFLSALILISVGLYKGINKGNYYKIPLYIIWIIFTIFIFLSGYMSGILFLIVSILSIILFKTKNSSIVKIILLIPPGLYFLILILSTYSVGPIKSKTEAFLLLIESGFFIDDSILNLITSNRWSAILYSINQFFDKPLYGHGIYLEDINGMLGSVDKYTTASGGHNFFIDLTAFMGIFSLPTILIYINFIKSSRRISLINKNNKMFNLNIAIYSVFVSVFISNILNSWLLFSAFDNFIFLLAGYVCGQLYLNKEIQKFPKKLFLNI